MLVRVLKPCVRIADNKPGMYDFISRTFFTNQGTGEFLTGKPKLPSEYYEVDYIQSDGNQYINSLVIPDNTTGVEIRLSLPDVTTDKFVWGCRENTGNTRFTIGKQSNYAYFGFGSFISGDFPIYIDKPFVARMNYYNSRVAQTNNNPTVQLPSIASITYTKPIYLFGTIGATGTITGISQKIFYCKISKEQNLVRYLTPCIRISDGKPGLYDAISKTFFTNQGTGEFTWEGLSYSNI